MGDSSPRPDSSVRRVVIESCARLPGGEPDDYAVDLTCDVRRVVAARVAWTDLPTENAGVVGAGNDEIAFRWASGRREVARLATGRASGFVDVLALVSAAAPTGVTVDRAPDADALVFRATDGDALALDGAASSARRLIGLPPAGSTPREPAAEARMPYEPDLAPDAYLHLFVDALGGPTTSSQATAGSCACVPRGYSEYAMQWIGPPPSGALSRVRVRFLRPGGFRVDFRGRDHAFALDLSVRS